jgi:hypothetical protein
MDPAAPNIVDNFFKVVSFGIYLRPTVAVFCQPLSWKRVVDKVAIIAAIMVQLCSSVAEDYNTGNFTYDAPTL